MEIEWLLTFLPLLALVLNISVQIISAHLTSNIRLSILMAIGSGVVFDLLLLFILPISSSFFTEDVVINLLTYLALSFCYWAFLNLNMTSMRIRIARELLKNLREGLSTENLFQRYSSSELISRRIQRLQDTGHITNQKGKWVLQSRKFIMFVWVSTSLRKLIIPSN
jgi:hypothetical protein